uniref:Uncharacterized protein n=1 Tax=Rhizophora mucronata TaxID=61149 RepID=A0A2P2MQK4_RHIMU
MSLILSTLPNHSLKSCSLVYFCSFHIYLKFRCVVDQKKKWCLFDMSCQ